MIKIAVTGALAAGKSSVCKIIKSEFHAYTLSSDLIVHSLLEKEPVQQKLVALIGKEILIPNKPGINNQLDRKKIAEKLFKNSPSSHQNLKLVEALLHPLVMEEIEISSKIASKEGYDFFVVEVPLLFESGIQNFFDKTIAVYADKKELTKRFFLRDQGDIAAFEARMLNQLSQEEKMKRADFTIQNSGSEEDLKNKVRQTIAQLQ